MCNLEARDHGVENEDKNCAINNDEFFAGIINKQIVNHLKLNLLFLHYI